MTEPAVTGGFVPRGTGVRVIPQHVTTGTAILGTALATGAGTVTVVSTVIASGAVLAGAGTVSAAGTVAGAVVTGSATLAATSAVTGASKGAVGPAQPSINVTVGSRRRPAHAVWSGVTGPPVARGTPTRFTGGM